MKRIALVIICTLSLISMKSSAIGQPGVPVMKLLPSDGAAGEEFGAGIEVAGTTALIWAASGGDAGVPTGSVYRFDLNTGAEIDELLPGDGGPYDSFGYSIDTQGRTALIGSPSHDGAGTHAGAVYLFDLSSGKRLAKLTAPDAEPGDIFGLDVAIDGAAALIGAFRDDGPKEEDTGSAYLFDLESGLVIHRFAPAGLESNDRFGASVAMNDSFIAVSASLVQHSGFRYGSVYVFDRASGELVYEITAELGIGFSQFGSQIEIVGGLLLVTSPDDDENGDEAGAVFVFELSTGTLLRKIVERIPNRQGFAASISSDGRLLAVGAIDGGEHVVCDCRVVVFDLLTGEQLLVIRHPQSEPHEFFGYPAVFGGSKLLVGSVRDDDNGVDAGAVFVFDLAPCFADLNRDGIADVADLGALIDGFGGADPVLDINGDGAVDAADLGLLIRSFGARCE